MRMKLGMFPRPGSDERGAVVVIVAISLVFLLGFLVLVVDLGGMVATRRAMVRAADSAALAAAQACAGTSTQSPNPGLAGESYADQYAIANVDLANLNSSAVNVVEYGALVPAAGGGYAFAPGVNNCQNGQPGYVTVEYMGTQDMFFARIWGAGTGDVVGRATAIWATTLNPGIVPFTMTEAAFVGCLNGTSTCSFTFPPPGGQPPSWGILDVPDTWNAANPPGVRSSNCTVSANQNYWNDIYNGSIRLTPPPPAWACMDTGLQSSVNVWDPLIGKTWVFPIADIIEVNQGGWADMAHIIDFACLRVTAIDRQGNTRIMRTVPESTCFSQGELDPLALGLGPQGTRLVE